MIITISREFGSGGRKLGKRLSETLHIPCYDKEGYDLCINTSGREIKTLVPALTAWNLYS